MKPLHLMLSAANAIGSLLELPRTVRSLSARVERATELAAELRKRAQIAESYARQVHAEATKTAADLEEARDERRAAQEGQRAAEEALKRREREWIAAIRSEAPDEALEEALEAAYWRYDALHNANYKDADPNRTGPMDEREAFKCVARSVAKTYAEPRELPRASSAKLHAIADHVVETHEHDAESLPHAIADAVAAKVRSEYEDFPLVGVHYSPDGSMTPVRARPDGTVELGGTFNCSPPAAPTLVNIERLDELFTLHEKKDGFVIHYTDPIRQKNIEALLSEPEVAPSVEELGELLAEDKSE